MGSVPDNGNGSSPVFWLSSHAQTQKAKILRFDGLSATALLPIHSPPHQQLIEVLPDPPSITS
jgi:hypothetical protein